MTFQQKCFLNGRVAVSFSDAPRENWFAPGLTHYVKKLNPAVNIPQKVCMAAFGDDGCHRWASDLRNLIWTYGSRVENAGDGDTLEVLENAQWAIIRSGEFSFACKGGHNAEPHNHNDVGSFMFNFKGDTFLSDVGVGMHSRQYFGAERYTFFPASSRGHSVPVIDGGYQQEGREFRANDFDVRRAGEQFTIGFEFGAAYGNRNIKYIRREFTVTPDASFIIMSDTFAFTDAPAGLTERLVTLLPPEDTGNGVVVIKGRSGLCEIRYDPSCWRLTLSKEHFKPSRDAENTAYCLDFNAIAPATRVTFEIKMSVAAS